MNTSTKALAAGTTSVVESRLKFKLFHRQSLKARVTLFTLVVFVLGIWSLAFYVSRVLRQDMQHMVGEQLFSNVSVLA